MNTRITALLSLLLAAAPAAGDVYRSVDANGNIIFSDTPTPGAEKIEVRELQTIPALAPAGGPAPDNFNEEGEVNTAAEEVVYESVAIANPPNDEALRVDGDTMAIPVSVAVKPNLVPGDTVVLYLDGKEYATGTGTSFTLASVERGTHQLRAVVRAPDGRIRQSSPSSSFHVLLHSSLQPAPTVGKPPKPPK